MKRIVIVTGAAALAWTMSSHSALVKVWAEAVFSNQVIVDTGHPGTFQLESIPPAKLAHMPHQYLRLLGEVAVIDDRPRRPKDYHRTFGERVWSGPRSRFRSALLRANVLWMTSRRDLRDLRLQLWRGLRVSPLFFFVLSSDGLRRLSAGFTLKRTTIAVNM